MPPKRKTEKYRSLCKKFPSWRQDLPYDPTGYFLPRYHPAPHPDL